MVKKFLILLLFCLNLTQQLVQAENTKPLQLAVFSPVQLVPEEDSIKGMRLSLFYTANKDVTGLSLVWLGVNRATGDVKGVEWGFVNWVEGSFRFLEVGLLNYVKKDFIGLQYGAVNVTKGDLNGAQWGFVNWTSGSMRGLQVGLANYTKSLHGIQIGLANYNGNKKPLEFMVFVNWSF